MSPERLPDRYFDDLYAGSADPWGFQDRWYERRKRKLTMALLPRPRYRYGFEPGCSLGVLTEALAGRCDRLLATDVSPAALSAARERLGGQDHVTFRSWALGDAWPDEQFDIVVLSEVLYYLQAPLLREVLPRAVAALAPGGTLLAVHWRHPVADYPLGGDEVHAELGRTPGLAVTARYQDLDVVGECFQRIPPEPVSVATAEGLV